MIFAGFLVLAAVTAQVNGHMSLEEPPARNVMWRMGFNHLPVHKDDDYLICTESGGKRCPPCGDSADTPPPHPHEGGGKWATGTITRAYTMGQNIEVHVNVTRSHGGFLEFKLCPHNDVKSPVTQRCLDQYRLPVVGKRGSTKVKINAPYDAPEMLTFQLKLPKGVTCRQCVLQMSNTAEQFKPSTIMFRNCADISIEGNAKTSMASGNPIPVGASQDNPFAAPQDNPFAAQPSRNPGFPNQPVLFPGASSSRPASFPSASRPTGSRPAAPTFLSTRGNFGNSRPASSFPSARPAPPSFAGASRPAAGFAGASSQPSAGFPFVSSRFGGSSFPVHRPQSSFPQGPLQEQKQQSFFNNLHFPQ